MNRRDAEAQSEEPMGGSHRSASDPLTHSPTDSLTFPTDWLLWQLADSAFPTGGFAHSGGLEAAYHHRTVRGGGDLAEYLRTALHQLAHASLPYVHAVFSSEVPFAEADQHCDAFLSNHVANRASRLQGQAILSTCERTFGLELLRRLQGEIADKVLPSHNAPVFGQIALLLGLDARATAQLFVFVQLRSWISAAVRLNIVGPMEGQRVQAELTADAEQCVAQFGKIGITDVAQSSPLLDLWQGTQDRLYSRLFQT
jgi:urease accessory protein